MFFKALFIIIETEQPKFVDFNLTSVGEWRDCYVNDNSAQQ